MDDRLLEFIDHAIDRGLDRATIRHVLLSAGWKEKDIAEAYCIRDLELPVPEPPAAAAIRAPAVRRTGTPRKARDAFLHLLAYGSLYVWSTSVILLLFTCLNFAFPDPAWRTGYEQLQVILSIVRFQLAIVIVSFPVFLFVWNWLLREVCRNPAAAKGVLRRWLGNMSLFVGAVTIAGDLMALVYFLLEGQLTIRFVLKAVVLFLIAGGLVVYLASTLRSEARAETDS